MTRGSWFLLGLLAFAVLASPAASRGSTIVWSRNTKSFSKQYIVSARPDGSHLRQLTRPKKGAVDIDASISPNGREVAFERDTFNPDTAKIGLVNANGRNERILDLGCVDPCAADAAPTWLRSGKRIAFTPVVGPFDQVNESATSAVLHTALLNGSDVERFSQPGIDGSFEDYHAHFSRDGSYVVFVRVRNADVAIAVFRADADGSDVRRLTPWGLGADLPDISLAASGPTEDLIVFETYGGGPPKGSSQNIATVPATCPSPAKCRKRIRYLTRHGDGPVQSFNPSWSPNGRRIAYTRFKPGDRHTPSLGDIWTMRADGSHRRAVSTSPLFEYRPDWGRSPAG